MNHHHHLPPAFPDNRFFTPTPSFNLNPNPNPNPNFNSTFILPPPPPGQFNSGQSQPHPEPKEVPPPDLSTSLSLLTHLLDLSSSTLLSLSSLLSHPPLSLSSQSECLSRCAFNPNHLMPPDSLFLHSLHCPSPIAEDVSSLIEALHYPKTLKSERQLIEQNKIVNPLSDPNSELSFSLDDCVDFSSNFFYQDCPGVVSSLSDDGGKRMFTLPGVLSIECANFASRTVGETDWILNDSVKLLPSEMWFVKCEIEQWSDFPYAYSHSILRALLGMEMVKEGDMLMWLIANSPCFGVIIDPPMRDHIFVLFRLCVKAIVREALRLYEPLLRGDLEETGCHLNPKTMSFSCPATVDVLSWLATQLSVLYGEANAKRVAIGMLKELLLNVASGSLVYPLEQNLDKVMGSGQGLMSSAGNLVADQPSGQAAEKNDEVVVSGGIVRRAIFVYQVAVAIAAVHERSLIENKIKALRNCQYMTAYQRLAEHGYMKWKAEEERKKRQNYRPLVEHDGLPLQRQHDKDLADRNKTKEQLLAEERDYKRRRMSYRGKKVKRNVKEVMRDIIEEHMEAIREAGGIGCFDSSVEDGSVSTSKPLALEYGQNMESNQGNSYEYEPSRNNHNVYKKHLNSYYSSQPMEPAEHAQDRKESSRSSHRDDFYHSRSPGRERNRGGSRDPRNRRRKERNEYNSYPRSPSTERSYGQWRDERETETEESDSYPRSPRRERNYSLSRYQRSDWKENEDDSYPRNSGTGRKYGQSRHQRSDRKLEREEDDSYLRSPSKERHGRSRDQSSWRNETEEKNYKSRSTSVSTTVHSGRKDKQRFEDSNRERRKRVRNDRSDSITGSEFDDRYAPSRSPET